MKKGFPMITMNVAFFSLTILHPTWPFQNKIFSPIFILILW